MKWAALLCLPCSVGVWAARQRVTHGPGPGRLVPRGPSWLHASSPLPGMFSLLSQVLGHCSVASSPKDGLFLIKVYLIGVD